MEWASDLRESSKKCRFTSFHNRATHYRDKISLSDICEKMSIKLWFGNAFTRSFTRPFARLLACVWVCRWLHAQDYNMINATSFSSSSPFSSSSSNAICFFHFTSWFLMLFSVKHSDFYQNEEHIKKRKPTKRKTERKKMWLRKSIVET